MVRELLLLGIGLVYTLAVWPQSIYEHPENAWPIFQVLLLMVVSYTMVFRFFAERCDAVFDCDTADGIFGVRLLIPLPSREMSPKNH